MKGPDLELARALFAEALTLDADTRRRMLDRRCGGDAALRAIVEELLEIDGTSSQEALGSGGSNWLAASLAAEPEPTPPPSIGSFRVVREIGRGAMGVVYEAIQSDPERRVAIKVIHAGMLGRGVQQRFRRETQVMAQLRHAGIAQIHEAGTWRSEEAGPRPYLVMELVEGVTLAQFAASQRLSLDARLELVARVCDALHHAHQKGVIHRDLKPDNILVHVGAESLADRGVILPRAVQPKILDFGVSRLVEPQEGQSLRTLAGQIVGTIPYLSPEQAVGDSADADTRSDVYALGIIAFELLSGALPFDTGGRSVGAAVRVVLESPPRRLGAVALHCRGDVETMVHKAMAREPEARYQSAAEFAADLRRYLRQEPVHARAPRALYIARMFIRRNRALTAVSAASLALLAAAVVVMSLLWLQASRSERQAMWQRYRSQMSAAGFAISKGEIGAARRQLDESSPQFRGWEYRHFLNSVDQSQRVVNPDFGRPFIAIPESRGGRDGVVLVHGTSAQPPVWISESDETREPLDPALSTWYLAIGSRGISTPFMTPRFLAPDPTTGEPRPRDLSSLLSPERHLSFPRVSANRRVMAMIRTQNEASSALVLLDMVTDDCRVHPLSFPAVRCGISGDGKVAAASTTFSRSARPLIAVLDASSGLVRCVIEGLSGEARSLVLNHDGSRLIASVHGGSIRVWDVSGPVPLLVHDRALNLDVIDNLTLSPDGTSLACGALDGAVRTFSASDVSGVAMHVGHESEVYSTDFTADGARIVSVGADGRVRWWSSSRPVPQPLVLSHHTHLVHAIAIAERFGLVATGSWDRTVKLARIEDGAVVATAQTPTFVQAMTLSPDGRTHATREFEGEVRIYSIPGLELIQTLDRRMRIADHPAFDASGTRLMIEFDVQSALATVWNLKTQQWEQIPGAELDAFRSPILNKTHHLIAIPKYGWPAVNLYDYRTECEVLSVEARRTANEAIAFSPDGQFMAAPDADHRIQVYRLPDGARIGAFTGHAREVLAMVWSPDGERFFSADYTGNIIISSVRTREDVGFLLGHQDHVRRLAISSDGSLLVSGSRDGVTRLWSADASRRPIEAERVR